MPGVRLFGRAWRIGSDDFVLPGFIDILVNTIWLVTSWIVFWRSDSRWDGCSGEQNMRLYFIGVLTALHLSFVTSGALVYWSTKGTIMDDKPRRFVPHCLYVGLFLQLFKIGWNILGTYWIYNGGFQCGAVPETAIVVISYVVCNWIVLVLVLIGIYTVFDPVGGKTEKRLDLTSSQYGISKDGISLSEIPDSEIGKVWRSRIRRWTFHLFSWSNEDKSAFSEAGKLFALVFGEEEFVPSDFVAGVILLSLQNHDANKEESELQEVIPESRKSLSVIRQPLPFSDFSDLYRKDWLHPIMLNHFLKFAKATYSAPFVFMDNKPRAMLRLLKNSTFCRCLPGRKREFKIIGDDYCFACCTAGVSEIVNQDDEGDDVKFVHMCFTNKVFRTPFFIAKDTNTKTIVVAIRGTMSLHDIVTDVVGWPTPFNAPGLPDSYKGHHGMVNCSKELKELLDKDGLLLTLMTENPDYGLVFTGTSLGAGVGAMLSIMYKPEYPNVKCYSYSPPGGLLTEDAAESCNDSVVSVIYGNDVVPRLSMRSIEKLKFNVIDCLKECQLPKYRVLFGGSSKARKRKNVSANTKTELTSPLANPAITRLSQTHVAGYNDSVHANLKENEERHSIISTESLVSLRTNNNKLQVDAGRLKIPVGDMWPPGKILYITQTSDFAKSHRRPGKDKNSVRWRWRWAKRTEFADIILHPRILGDHLPYRMHKAVSTLARNQTRYGPLPLDDE